jgi:hypothetical protein
MLEIDRENQREILPNLAQHEGEEDNQGVFPSPEDLKELVWDVWACIRKP